MSELKQSSNLLLRQLVSRIDKGKEVKTQIINRSLMQVSAKTRRKPAYITIAVPDEVAAELMRGALRGLPNIIGFAAFISMEDWEGNDTRQGEE